MRQCFAFFSSELKIKDRMTQLLRISEHFRSFSPRNSEFGAKLRFSEPVQALIRHHGNHTNYQRGCSTQYSRIDAWPTMSGAAATASSVIGQLRSYSFLIGQLLPDILLVRRTSRVCNMLKPYEDRRE